LASQQFLAEMRFEAEEIAVGLFVLGEAVDLEAEGSEARGVFGEGRGVGTGSELSAGCT
jgi:hypothetical protein